MKKRFMALMTCFAAAAALVSCGNSSDSSSASKTEPASAKATLDSELVSRAQENMKKQLGEHKELSSSLSKSNIPCDKAAEETAKNFITALFTGETAEKISFTYPEALCKAITEAGGEKNFKQADISGSELKEFHITGCSRLAPDTGYKLVEEFYRKNAEIYGISSADYTVTDGYCAEIYFTVIANGEKDSDTEEIILVNIKGEGWKVIPFSINTLKDQLDAMNKE